MTPQDVYLHTAIVFFPGVTTSLNSSSGHCAPLALFWEGITLLLNEQTDVGFEIVFQIVFKVFDYQLISLITFLEFTENTYEGGKSYTVDENNDFKNEMKTIGSGSIKKRTIQKSKSGIFLPSNFFISILERPRCAGTVQPLM